jgi:hypothetical protein
MKDPNLKVPTIYVYYQEVSNEVELIWLPRHQKYLQSCANPLFMSFNFFCQNDW